MANAVATHESAHAVVHLALGGDLRCEASIGRTIVRLDACPPDLVLDVQPGDQIFKEIFGCFRPFVPEHDGRRLALMSIAGALAEARVSRPRRPWRGFVSLNDQRGMRHGLRLLGLPFDVATIFAFAAEVRLMFEEPPIWRAIERVAEELERVRKLDGPRMFAIVRAAGVAVGPDLTDSPGAVPSLAEGTTP